MKKHLSILLFLLFLSFSNLFAERTVPAARIMKPSITGVDNCGMFTLTYSIDSIPPYLTQDWNIIDTVVYNRNQSIHYFLQNMDDLEDTSTVIDSNNLVFYLPSGNYRIVSRYVIGSGLGNDYKFSLPNNNGARIEPVCQKPYDLFCLDDHFGLERGFKASKPRPNYELKWYKEKYGNTSYYGSGEVVKPGYYFERMYVECYDPATNCTSERVMVKRRHTNRKINTTVRIPNIKSKEDFYKLQLSDCYINKEIKDFSNQTIYNISLNSTPNHSALLQFNFLEDDGAARYSFLPYPVPNDRAYNKFTPQDALDYYASPAQGVQTNLAPFTETDFEESYLRRPLEIGSPGNLWKMDDLRIDSAKIDTPLLDTPQYVPPTYFPAFEEIDIFDNGKFGPPRVMDTTHTKRLTYSANIANQIIDFYAISKSPSPQTAAIYFPDNFLRMIEFRDENKNKAKTFTDLKGRKICEMVEFKKDQYLSTYYLYDDFDQISMILQPEGFALMKETNNYKISLQSDYTFEFKYDKYKRLIWKKTPAGGVEEMLYDKANRLRFSQSAAMKSQNKWNYIKYDVNNRIVSTGICESSFYSQFLQTLIFTNFPDLNESEKDGFYTNITYPTSGYEELTVNYYDDYGFENPQTHPNFKAGKYGKPSTMVFNKLTRTKSRLILPNGNFSTEYYNTYFWYDEDGRILQTNKQFPENRTLITSNSYNFISQPTAIYKELINNGTTLINTKDTIHYDHAGRPLDLFFTVNNDNEVHMCFYKYNDLGQLIQKKLHYDWMWGDEGYMQIIDYRYNERGWLKKINSTNLTEDIDNESERDAFAEELFYGDAHYENATGSAALHVKPQYNGNIAMMQWATKSPNSTALSSPRHTYVYDYDAANRLLKAQSGLETMPFVPNPDGDGKYNESMQYDRNGNIKSIGRYGIPNQLDSLTMLYKGNRLVAANDLILNTTINNDFEDNGSNDTLEYYYDGTGNLLQDKNKGLKFTYNFLNLPSKIYRAATTINDTIKYTYDATGKRLRKVRRFEVTDYIDGFEFVNNTLRHGPTAEGRFRPKNEDATNPQQFVYDYDIKDHLDNVRVTLTNENVNKIIIATEEPINNPTERQLFLNIEVTRGDKDPSSPPDTTYTPDEKVSKLTGTGNNIGFTRIMEMTAGETVDFSVKYYQDIEPFTSNTENVVSTITTQLMNIFFINNPNYAGYTSEEMNPIIEQANNTFGANSNTPNFLFNLLKDPNAEEFTKAQLVYLYFDHEFNLLENFSGSLAATEEGVLGSLLLEGLKPEQDGFLYIFAINETSNPIDFDNLIVAHKTGTLLAVNHYYPFGLRWNGQGSLFHKYQFGGKEYEEELNLNTYDFHARQMDPVLGRFWGVDPMSSERVSFSPFNYVQNNPMSRVDPSGMLDESYRNRLQNTDGSSSDYEGNNFIETTWTKTNLELLIGTEWEDMIGQIAIQNDINMVGDGEKGKKDSKEKTELSYAEKMVESAVSDVVLVGSTIVGSISNGYSAYFKDIESNGLYAGYGKNHPKGTSLSQYKFSFQKPFLTKGEVISNTNSAKAINETILSTFSLMTNVPFFNIKVLTDMPFANFVVNQIIYNEIGKGLKKVTD